MGTLSRNLFRGWLLVIALAIAGCSPSGSSRTVVEPTALGSWASTERLGGGHLRITLQNGDVFEIEETRDQRALAFASAPEADTVLAAGDGPNGRWWILSDIETRSERLPPGCHLLIAYAYDEPGSVVFLAPPDSGKGFGAEFWIRLPKAPGVKLTSPPPENPPFFEWFNRFCLDENGFVTSVQL
jgi:hypothetical protein